MQQGKRPTKPTAAPGATCLGGERVRFRVWAPRCRQVALRVVNPVPREPVAMAPARDGWCEIVLEGLGPGTRYVYVLDGKRERPDPMSRAQPEGVHGPSEVVDTSAFAWTASNWRGLSLREMVLYEIHVGTFTPEGNFRGRHSAPGPAAGIGRHRHRAHAGGELSRSAELGLRRRGAFRPPAYIRRAGGPPASGGRLSHSRPGRRARRRLQPPRTRRQLPGRVRPLLH